jgi:hypothetical protein
LSDGEPDNDLPALSYRHSIAIPVPDLRCLSIRFQHTLRPSGKKPWPILLTAEVKIGITRTPLKKAKSFQVLTDHGSSDKTQDALGRSINRAEVMGGVVTDSSGRIASVAAFQLKLSNQNNKEKIDSSVQDGFMEDWEKAAIDLVNNVS